MNHWTQNLKEYHKLITEFKEFKKDSKKKLNKSKGRELKKNQHPNKT